MKTITIAEIRSFNPCYDPNKYLSETFNGSLKEILENKEIPPQDRLWVVVRAQLMPQLQLKYYGLGCARLAEQFTTNPVVKSCNDATEAYLKGNINKEELLKHKNADAAFYASAAASSYAFYASYAASYAAFYAASYAADASYAAAAAAADAAAAAAASYAAYASYASYAAYASYASYAAAAYYSAAAAASAYYSASASYASYDAAAYYSADAAASAVAAADADAARNEMREKQCKLLINILETIE